jgi:hypothetical protein
MTRIIAICIDDEENVSGCLTNCLHAAENRMQRQQISRPVSDRSLQIPPCVLHWQDNHRAKLFRAMEPTLRGYESRRQSQCIGGTQQVNTKKPYLSKCTPLSNPA